MDRVWLYVRRGDGTVRDDGTFTDSFRQVKRCAMRRSGYEVVRYYGKYYQLFGGIRVDYHINLTMPLSKA